MRRLTLLEIVQSVLSSMDSDAVTTISETVESEQVLAVAQEVYDELMSDGDWPHLQTITVLEAVGDVTKPTYTKIPDTVTLLLPVEEDEEDGTASIIKYNTTQTGDSDTTISTLTYLSPSDFLSLVYSRNTSDANVTSYSTPDGVPLFIKTDKMPEYWTTFDDEYVVFDSIDLGEDATIQSSKTVVHALKATTFTLSDTFIPDLPIQMFPMYLARVKAKCHSYFKQQISQLDIQESARGKSRQRRKSRKTRGTHTRTDYGRHR